jgi:hypothetical protein
MDKKIIIREILKSSGPLASTFLKERVVKRLGISDEDYAKSTFHKHLQDMCDQDIIKFKEDSGKRIYYVEESKHNVQGGLLVDKYNGRINVPDVLAPFDVRIDEWMKPDKSINDITIHFEFNSTLITFSIHKYALPFKLHISRKNLIQDISESIKKLHGARVVTLELPVAKMSSFKMDQISGQLLLSFNEEGEVSVLNLSSVSKNAILRIKDLNYSNYFEITSKVGVNTLHTTWGNSSTLKIEGHDLNINEEQNVRLPLVISASSDCKIVIF